MAEDPVQNLARARKRLLDTLDPLDDRALRTQYHPELSPPGWHLGHCAYIETYWIRDALLGQKFSDTVTAGTLYLPDQMPKSERGQHLPEKSVLIDHINQRHSENDTLLLNRSDQISDHPLMTDGYLYHFLTQHYSQHIETVQAILAQRTLHTNLKPESGAREKKHSTPDQRGMAGFPTGEYLIGGTPPGAYDNELPAHRRTLKAFHISTRPATNGEFLNFMADGGYQTESLWTKEGWRWRTSKHIEAPGLWRHDSDSNWHIALPDGYHPVESASPVQSLSWYEADAYARWCGGRLPSEFEWEAASRAEQLEEVGGAWEWCGNAFAPYEGFRPFPYPEYSQPWFDGRHFVLRGNSPWTRNPVRRHSFRNFYQPDTRFLLSGVRVADT